jgi:DNA-binding SARP family transcriptional activator/Tfp pilus assembly protein PilF
MAVDGRSGTEDSQHLRFALLGTVFAVCEGQELAAGPPRQRAVLAMLALRANRVVPRDELVDGVWGADPPASAVNGVHIIVGALRRMLEPARARRAPGRVLVSAGSGYRLAVTPEQVDVGVYDGHLRRARTRQAAGEPAAALLAFDAALELWRGTPLTGVPGPFAQTERTRLTELWLAAAESRAEALIELGDLGAATAELSRLVAEHPLREGLRVLLMRSLHRAGRQADALEAYADARQLLKAELGVEPGAALRQLHLDILSGREGGPANRRNRVLATGRGDSRGSTGPVAPRQLPPAIRHFTGRLPELAALTVLADAVRPGTGATVIATIDGTAGVGKTALAVYWAHRVSSRFPGGQLYVNLRGFDPGGAPMPPTEAIRGFLDAFGVLPDQIPAGADAQAALYRSLLADRRVLVVLDNAASTDQVRPLLPGSPACLVLVTSRNRLSGLVALQGAHPFTLDVLTADQARGQLAEHLGADRLVPEAHAVDEIIASCAGLPLALAIVAARVAGRPGLPLALLAEQLRATRGSLDGFDDGDLTANARTAFSWSYERLSDRAARLFRLLGLHPGTDATLASAASLAGLPATQVRPPLAELRDAHLLTEHLAGRFGAHDLLRAYAAEQCRATDSEGERRAAVGRVLDHYLHTAYAGATLLNPHREQISLAPASAGSVPEAFVDHRGALDWFAAERAVLMAAVRHAASAGLDQLIRPFAWCLTIFLQRHGHWHEWVEVQQAALDAAGRLGDRRAAADAHRHLARAYIPLARFADARQHLAQALEKFRAEGDRRGTAQTHLNLGLLFERQGRHHEALRHTRQALDLFAAADNTVMQARALNAIGWLHAQLGDHQQAIVDCREALRILESLGDLYGQASTWDSIGFAHHRLGEYELAIAGHRHALEIRRDLGDRSSQATVLIHLGDAHLAAGNRHAAQDAWRQALDLLDDLRLAGTGKVRAKLAALESESAAR